MTGLLLLVLLPLTFLFYRESPLGAAVATLAARTPAEDQARVVSFIGEILLTRRFVQFGTLVFLVSFVVGGMMIHLQPLFRAHGLSTAAAASAYAFYGVGGIVGRLGGGWALDRFGRGPAPALPMCVFPVLAAGLALIAGGTSLTVHALIALLIGVAAGVEVDVVPYLVRRYFPAALFGRAYLGRAAIFVSGAGAAPFLVSLWYDATGSYYSYLLASIAMGLAAAALLLALGRYPAALVEQR
jgi:MFS family permease